MPGSTMQLWLCLHRSGKESPKDQDDRAQGGYTRRGDLEKSAIAECAWNHHHQVDWDKIKVLDKVANIITLLIKKPSTSASGTRIHWWTETKASQSQTAGQQPWVMPNLWWGWHQAPTNTGMMTSLIMMKIWSGSRSGNKAKVEAETQD